VRDLRYALRLLIATPAVTLLVSGLLALGIGATTVVFSIFEAVLLRPLYADRPDQLVRLVQRLPRVGGLSSFPEAFYDVLRDRATTLALVFGQTGEYVHSAMTVPAPAEEIAVRGVTPRFFDGLGVQPLEGRTLHADDDRPSGNPPVVLSHRLWQRRFGGDREVIGRSLAVNGRYFTIVGIMPEPFHGLTADTSADLWMPLAAYRTMMSSESDRPMFELAGRLTPGAQRSAAEAECREIWQSTMDRYYRDIEHRSAEDAAQLVARNIELESLERGVSILRDSFDRVLKVAIAASLLLLLIVCLSVGGILMTRAVARQHERAVQLALGASPMALVRQVAAEGVLLTALAAIAGSILAAGLLPLAQQVLPPIRDRSGALLPLMLSVNINRPVLVFIVAIALLATVCFTAGPALVAYRSPLETVLRSVRTTTGRRGREVLTLLQVALCVFFLAMSALFVRTLHQLREVDTGFDVDEVATFSGHLGAHAGTNAPIFLTMLTSRMREIPNVVSTAVSSVAVMRGRGVSWTIAPAGERITKAHFLDASGNTVSAEYFETMGMRVSRGRGFTAADSSRRDAITAVVNRAFVTKFFPNVDPVGKRFGIPHDGVAGGDYEIVGVVDDAKYRSLREPMAPVFYALGVPSDAFVFNVRTRGRPDAIIEPVRKALASVDPSLAFREVHTMREEVENSVANERLTAALASFVGVFAVVFAAAGIYASIGYIAAQRRRELAIRVVLGAGRMAVVSLVARRTLAMLAVGIPVGLGAASLAAFSIPTMLFNVSSHDGVSLAAAGLIVAVAAGVGTAVPTVRIVRMDPAEALRHE
jgi:predicted permease